MEGAAAAQAAFDAACCPASPPPAPPPSPPSSLLHVLSEPPLNRQQGLVLLSIDSTRSAASMRSRRAARSPAGSRIDTAGGKAGSCAESMQAAQRT